MKFDNISNRVDTMLSHISHRIKNFEYGYHDVYNFDACSSKNRMKLSILYNRSNKTLFCESVFDKCKSIFNSISFTYDKKSDSLTFIESAIQDKYNYHKPEFHDWLYYHEGE